MISRQAAVNPSIFRPVPLLSFRFPFFCRPHSSALPSHVRNAACQSLDFRPLSVAWSRKAATCPSSQPGGQPSTIFCAAGVRIGTQSAGSKTPEPIRVRFVRGVEDDLSSSGERISGLEYISLGVCGMSAEFPRIFFLRSRSAARRRSACSSTTGRVDKWSRSIASDMDNICSADIPADTSARRVSVPIISAPRRACGWRGHVLPIPHQS